MKIEDKYRNQLIKIEAIVKRNSLCRKKKDLTSCGQCDIYNDCLSNGYDRELAKGQKIERQLSFEGAYRIRKEIRS